jgi:hypothetical protein
MMNYEREPYHWGVPDEELLAGLRGVSNELGKSRGTYRQYNMTRRFAAGAFRC